MYESGCFFLLNFGFIFQKFEYLDLFLSERLVMGVVEKILLSILAILVPPIAALIKVYRWIVYSFELRSLDYLGRLYDTFLDKSTSDASGMVTWYDPCTVVDLGRSFRCLIMHLSKHRFTERLRHFFSLLSISFLFQQCLYLRTRHYSAFHFFPIVEYLYLK